MKKIYCDFDGTITKNDAVSTFFEYFADKEWLEVEKLWQEGKITSKECLKKQVELVPSITQQTLNEYINSIEIDDYFVDFYNYMKSKNVKIVILSDGFDLFISRVLELRGLYDIEFFANHLVYKNNKLALKFLNHNPSCKVGAGACKCNQIKEKEYCYVGDGLTDLCVAKKAKILFAKGTLKQNCELKNIEYNSYDSFLDIIEYSQRGEKDATTYSFNY